MSTETQVVQAEILEPLKRLTRDLANAAVTLSTQEARFLVDNYYTMQLNRIAADHQIRKLESAQQPHEVLEWFSTQSGMLESQVKRALDKWTDGHPVGIWAKSISGIGPVIAAGLLANIDITRSVTAGDIWAFAGLNPDMTWKKGEKRPYNATLKTLLAFKLGESFVKVQNNEHDVYGKVFAWRKKAEQENNERGVFASTAKMRMSTVGEDTDAYKAYASGKLPPAHIHARARRYAVKLFVSHYHMVAYFQHFQKLPPFPYVFSHLQGHIHFIQPPNSDLIDGLIPALRVYEDEIRHSPELRQQARIASEKEAAKSAPPAKRARRKAN